MRNGAENMRDQSFKEFYDNVYFRIEKNIDDFNLNMKKNNNPMIFDGIQRFCGLNSGGKRLRGILVYIGYCMMCDDAFLNADALAMVFEVFQTAILVHDDVFDHADSRRGMETIHTGYYREFFENGNMADSKTAFDTACAMAICLGDLGFYQAEELMSVSYCENKFMGRLLSFYHKMVIETIKGEMLDIQLPYMLRNGIDIEKKYKNMQLEDMIYEIYHMKTSCYTVIGPLCSGMILGGASDILVKKMECVADDLGLAFQMQDDILGIYSDQAKLGKNVGSDISEYKQTLLYSFTKDQGGTAYEKLMRYYGKSNITLAELKEVQDIFRDCGALEYVEKKVAELFDRAKFKLSQIKEISNEKKQLLYGFIEFVQMRKG